MSKMLLTYFVIIIENEFLVIVQLVLMFVSVFKFASELVHYQAIMVI